MTVGTVVLQQAVAASSSWLALGSDLLRLLFVLGAVCGLAWLCLRFAAARGFGKTSGAAHMEVLERLPLDTQRALYLVRVEQRRLVIGAGQGGAPQLLLELDTSKSLGDVDVSVAGDGVAHLPVPPRDATH